MADHQYGDAPAEAEYIDKMRRVASALDEVFNDGKKGSERHTGFLLMVFKFGEGGRCNYISNGAAREDVVALMKEQIARFEGQPEVEGNA